MEDTPNLQEFQSSNKDTSQIDWEEVKRMDFQGIRRKYQSIVSHNQFLAIIKVWSKSRNIVKKEVEIRRPLKAWMPYTSSNLTKSVILKNLVGNFGRRETMKEPLKFYE